MTIQHLRSSTANKRPTPAAMSDGQLAVNTNTASPGLFFKDSAGALIKVGPVHVGTTAPNASPASGGETGNTVGEQWLDTSGGTYVFKVWDGSAWRSESGTFVDVNGDVMTGALGIIAGSAGSPGLYFSGDTNTGIYSPGADQVAISTGGSGRLFVDASGRLGVGTSSPSYVLDVAGSARVKTGATGTPFIVSTGSDSQGSIRFGSSGGVGVYGIYGGADYTGLQFWTGGVQALTIDNSQRVGVGTASPSEALNVVSPSTQAVFEGSTQGNIVIKKTGVGGFSLYSDAAGTLAFYDGNSLTERLRIDSSGRVGIGVTSVSNKLTVRDSNETAIVSTAAIENYVTGNPFSGNGVALDFNLNNNGNATINRGRIAIVNTNYHAESEMRFYTATSNAIQQRMVLDSQGRLGIGTTSPAGKCVVRVSNNTGAPTAWNSNFLVVSTGDASTSSGLGFSLDASDGSASISALTPGTSWLKQYYRANSHTFWYGDAGVTQGMTLDSSGRLLVGTSTSRSVGDDGQSPLQISGTGYGGISIVNNRNDLSGPAVVLAKNRSGSVGGSTIVQNGDSIGNIIFAGADGTDIDTPGAYIQCFVDGTPGANDMPGRLVFSTTADGASSPTERMRINSSGQTRILGSSAPLTVRTTLAAGTSDYIFLGYRSATNMSDGVDVIDIFTNGNVVNTNNSYGAISDAKLKENIVDSGSQWSDLKSLRIRKYNFKEETGRDAHTQIGLIAQEVELVSPGLVSESPDRDAEGNDLGTVTKSVNYSVLYMKAVKALQEAMKRIETLEAKVAALESA